MPFIGVSILIQILCAVHCLRRGGCSNRWLMVIIFLSVPGCLAYFVFEILPGLTARRDVRAAQAAAIRKLDPEREVRAARDALDLADTAANRIDLGDALVELGRPRQAIEHYRCALAKMPAADRGTTLKLARAELAAGNGPVARELIEQLPQSQSASENDRTQLLLACAVEECGDKEAAVAILADLGQRLPGCEPQCRRAALLLALGRPGEAQESLEEVEKRLKRIDRFERSQNKDMYDWAGRTLRELRGP